MDRFGKTISMLKTEDRLWTPSYKSVNFPVITMGQLFGSYFKNLSVYKPKEITHFVTLSFLRSTGYSYVPKDDKSVRSVPVLSKFGFVEKSDKSVKRFA